MQEDLKAIDENMTTEEKRLSDKLQQCVDYTSILTRYGTYQILPDGRKLFAAED